MKTLDDYFKKNHYRVTLWEHKHRQWVINLIIIYWLDIHLILNQLLNGFQSFAKMLVKYIWILANKKFLFWGNTQHNFKISMEHQKGFPASWKHTGLMIFLSFKKIFGTYVLPFLAQNISYHVDLLSTLITLIFSHFIFISF